MRRWLPILALLVASCAPSPPPDRALSLDTLPPMRAFAAASPRQPTRPNAEIERDFLDLAFRMESGRVLPVMTRFEEPITVRVAGAAPASLAGDLEALLARLRTEAGIDIRRTGGADAAITVQAIPSSTLQGAVPRAACFVVPRVSSWQEFLAARRTPQVDWTTLTRRDRAAIFVPADAAPQEIRDCLHEELAQAIGPLNDLYRLPDSVFNDDNIQAVLTGFDMLILAAYYAPELRNGMSRAEVALRLPGVLARLNPGGARGRASGERGESRDWVAAIEEAMARETPTVQRRAAAAEAIRMGRAFGWGGARAGFASYAYGRLLVGHDTSAALAAFHAADRAYAQDRLMRIHRAHVAVQLSAFALSAGDGEAVLGLVEPALAVAQEYENAALLATLLMFKTEALTLLDRTAEAEAVRLDSLAWARYGFGSESSVRARQREIAALRPDGSY
ncbi:hypothetical protein OG2516_02049 [Oceanicola granulosus HTCC2516]|uniref:ATP-dependent transcriptional regulator n=1 Tax=Oceanicola granulosus (strain ATCC BAA-861 / DSM 15982 / KCTC 12143 / HTCC2516) TaxID=314256 RepID=Q2CHW4_OCEGH|nr:DUF2927 domain-containing protein [Oceanicola granulosus]EAR52180.1 hypothetical protein OG2516_02049 [Oceanicola granulosus HTCC2516]